METQNAPERPKSGRTYTDEEWETVRQPFHHFYIEKNLSLREAATRMKQLYNFDATPRQWERRIAPEKWNMPKYTNRDDRIRTLEAVGKSLHDIGHRGRRKSTGSPDERLNIDRNMRRWARRELSRDSSRPRAKSVSGLSDVSDQEMDSIAPSPAATDYVMEDYSQPLFGDPFLSSAHSSQGSPLDVPEIRVDEFQEKLPIPQITFSQPRENDADLSMSHINTRNQVNPQVLHEAAGSGETEYHNAVLTNPTSYGNEHIQQETYNWADNHPIIPQADPDFFTSYRVDSDTSYVAMLGDKSDSIYAVDDINGYVSGELSQENMTVDRNSSPLMEHNFDNTHNDVHTLLQEHYSKTVRMIEDCMQSCRRSGASEQVMQILELLETGMKAQNGESDLDIRKTLKNISATQRQATRSIFDLSKARKKEIVELKDQLRGFQNSFAYQQQLL